MPAREDNHSKRRSRREDDSPKAKEKERPREKTKLEKKHSRRQSTPERPKSTVKEDLSEGSRMARSSMTDLPPGYKKPTVHTVPEMSRRASVGESKLSSYPAFSKEHSREAVRPGQEAAKSKVSILTPDPTEPAKLERSRPTTPGAGTSTRAPPSPPLTADEAEIRRTSSANSFRKPPNSPRQDAGRRSVDLGSRQRTAHLRAEGASSPRKASRGEDSDSSARATDTSKGTARRHTPTTMTERERSASHKTSLASHELPTASQATSNSDSQATSIAPERKASRTAQRETGSAKTSPVPAPPPVTQPAKPSAAPPIASMPMRPFSQPIPSGTASIQNHFPAPFNHEFGAAPPPPPPPMDIPDETPRVDYLLMNGGLQHVIPKSLISGTAQSSAQSFSIPRRPTNGIENDASKIFQPITSRLDDLDKVMNKNGSVAVATGYRSVARRLLDRLENVFARNISSEKCLCVVCKSMPEPNLSAEEQDGVSWGEILEFVSGRRELPQWPPFTFDSEAAGLGITGKVDAPMQKLDPDVPDEFRQHYMRQNDKTKRSVQDWLKAQSFDSAQPAPPQDVDDETLSFAMLTRLDSERRSFFTALMRGHSTLPNGRSPSPSMVNGEVDNSVLDKTSLALQRLYRLARPPRRPESTLYLLNNAHLHSMLATLAAISPTEWDILVSGRFDGFLWSGAEQSTNGMPWSAAGSRPPTRGPTPLSRNSTPFHPTSRNTTPFSPPRNASSASFRGATPMSTTSTSASGAGGPVQHDEETEIAVVFELERTIYRDMELLEDAFEAVHQHAEALRSRLRARAAGLSVAAQARRGSSASEIEVRIGTPGSAWGGGDEAEGAVFDDGRSELAPDDSASNVSFARRKRRGTERRTPGVEEEGGTAADRRRRR